MGTGMNIIEPFRTTKVQNKTEDRLFAPYFFSKSGLHFQINALPVHRTEYEKNNSYLRQCEYKGIV